MTLGLNRAAVFGSAIVYWAGVWVQARRIRHRTGRSTRTRPHGTKERLLWAGWCLVVAGWLGLPFLASEHSVLPGARIFPVLLHPIASAVGIGMLGAGYLGTLWCYAAMGDSWRMGIGRGEKTALVTRGPYRLVRHPIYLFQVVMVAAIPLLLPSGLAWLVLIIHVVCVRIKATDEELYLGNLLGGLYQDYCATTGRWFPRLRRRGLSTAGSVPSEPLDPADQPVK